MNSLYLSIPFLFLEFSSFSGRLKARKYEFPFKCQHCDDFFCLFFYFFYLRKGFLVFMNPLLVFCLYLLRSWMLNGMLVFGLMAFFLKDGCGCPWWFVSVRILPALLMRLRKSAFSELIRLEPWSWRIANWLEREELIESHLAL